MAQWMKNVRRVCFFVGLLLALSAPALAQGGATTASLSGRVVDSSDSILPGVAIVAKNNATGETFNA